MKTFEFIAAPAARTSGKNFFSEHVVKVWFFDNSLMLLAYLSFDLFIVLYRPLPLMFK